MVLLWEPKFISFSYFTFVSNITFDFHLLPTFFFFQNQCISQLHLELNGRELDEGKRRNDGEEGERWQEREEEISLRDFVPDESEYQLPLSKFTLLLVR